jgi:hypothetical protein
MVEKKKKGKPVPIERAIPPELSPFYFMPIRRRKLDQLRKDLRRICRKAGVAMPRGFGVHAIRRRVDTMLEELTDVSLKPMDASMMDASIFMRWSTTSRFGMHGRYAKIDEYESNRRVLEQHTMVHFWKDYVDCWAWAPGFENIEDNYSMNNTFMLKYILC